MISEEKLHLIKLITDKGEEAYIAKAAFAGSGEPVTGKITHKLKQGEALDPSLGPNEIDEGKVASFWEQLDKFEKVPEGHQDAKLVGPGSLNERVKREGITREWHKIPPKHHNRLP